MRQNLSYDFKRKLQRETNFKASKYDTGSVAKVSSNE